MGGQGQNTRFLGLTLDIEQLFRSKILFPFVLGGFPCLFELDARGPFSRMDGQWTILTRLVVQFDSLGSADFFFVGQGHIRLQQWF